ncbi:hypothetical protein H4R19_006511 [Coemansia spiralis]|nr:hypothetical protein H4R19_006511 [Coemansia spiralis]
MYEDNPEGKVDDGDTDYVAFQFGTVGLASYTVDVRYPLSPLAAMGIAIAARYHQHARQ